MNKKSLFGLFAMGTVLFAASCQEEDVVSMTPENAPATVSVNVTTPELGAATRAFGDGTTAQTLHYAVYNVKTDGNGDTTRTYLPDLTVENHTFELKTTVDLQLVTGNTYDVIFWADNEGAPYNIGWADGKVSVDYAGVTCNNEAYDAFFNWMRIEVNGSKTESIKLYRPFGQLNIGTNDIAKAASAGYAVKATQVGVATYNTLDLWSKEVSGDTTVTFEWASLPTAETFPVKAEAGEPAYNYLAMNYLLLPTDKKLVDVTFDYTDSLDNKQRTFSAVPVRRNWRTNIYGQLLTSDVDVNVEIVPLFEDEAVHPDSVYNVVVWDGSSLTKPEVDVVNKIVYIGQASEKAYVADKINSGGQSNAANAPATRAGEEDTFDYTAADVTFVLINNIDLGGENWTPISGFKGTFDGKGYTVSNLKVSTEGRASAGLFGSSKGVIKNLTVKDADIQGHYKTGVIVGDGLCGKIENCHVENAKVLVTPFEQNEANNVGGIVGYLSAELTAYVKDCSVKNAEITAYRKVGGIVGAANGASVVTGNSVENVTVVADFTMEYNEVKPADVGAIVGYAHANAIVSNNTEGENVFAGNRIADGVYMQDGVYEIHTVAGLKWLAETVNNGDNFSKKTVTLAKDIDLNAEEWTPIGNSTTAFQGTFDGQNHVVKNLVINAEGKSNIGLFGMTTSGEIKNLVVENAKVTGRLNVGVVAGTPYTSKYTNITVQGHVEVNGMSYVGGVGGKDAYANWTDVTVNVDETSYVKANSVENGTAYRSYVGGVIGFMGEGGHTISNVTSNIDVKGSTCDVGGIVGIAHYGNSFVNVTCNADVEIYAANEEADAQEIGGIAGVWHNGGADVTFKNCKFNGELTANNGYVINTKKFSNLVCAAYSAAGTGKLIVDGVEYMQTENGVTIDGAAVVQSATELNDALKAGESVVMVEDVTIETTTESNGYGSTGINVKAGQVFDGCGNTLSVPGANTTWASAIATTGGTIKNVTITAGFRGIFMPGATADVYVDNVVIGGNGLVYTFNSDAGNKNYGVYISNSTLNGWTSHSDVHKEVVYTNCSFGEGSGYAFCRPYGPTSFVGCAFEAGFQVDARGKITFENCTIGGVALTAENLATLVTSNISNATVK